MKKAAEDPLFIKDINKTMDDFQLADDEIIRHDKEWPVINGVFLG